MSDFDGEDLGFVTNPVVGLRSFKVDPDGTLRGPIYPHVIEPGENSAKCISKWRDMPRLDWPWDHHVAVDWCTCGYYAYTDGSNDHHIPLRNRVEGIIEGYGHVTRGDRGFRAEKCKVLAVVKPSPENFPSDSTVLRNATLIINIIITVWWLWLTTSSIRNAMEAFHKNDTSIAFVYVALAVVDLVVGFFGGGTYRLVRGKSKRPSKNALFKKLQEHYPDVAVFDTREQALKAFPLKNIA